MTALYAFLTGCAAALGLGFLLVRHGREGERTKNRAENAESYRDTRETVKDATWIEPDASAARRRLRDRASR